MVNKRKRKGTEIRGTEEREDIGWVTIERKRVFES